MLTAMRKGRAGRVTPLRQRRRGSRYGSLGIVNLFGLRATDPRELALGAPAAVTSHGTGRC